MSGKLRYSSALKRGDRVLYKGNDSRISTIFVGWGAVILVQKDDDGSSSTCEPLRWNQGFYPSVTVPTDDLERGIHVLLKKSIAYSTSGQKK